MRRESRELCINVESIVSDETEQQADPPATGERNGVQVVILAAVLIALGVFFVRRAL
ncbi:MAG TPA: LPXTG cell wall anchor domain-containing protein [Casimicrobiaceae bacterium]|jgi:LPXTG-motif cell wall-anchored protein|nr:LPXTG cell wall anchor domain-containing protein [Gemmatimonadaceae bacterium]HWC46135.1 LPXTG cell wall anchor domain-containing protein [Casimicrobiaceae bacterium]